VIRLLSNLGVKFDHDFIGRAALEKIVQAPRRKKVTLAWNAEDATRAMGTMFAKGDPVKYIDLPLSNYSTWPYDKVRDGDRTVGVSTFSGYSYNERSMLSLAILDVDVEIGTEVVLVGEIATRLRHSRARHGAAAALAEAKADRHGEPRPGRSGRRFRRARRRFPGRWMDVARQSA
jgi:glycine cleavage system aminomethyltransferase T